MRSDHEEALILSELQATIDRLETLTSGGHADDIISLLDEVIPGATIKETPAPDLTSII